MSKRPLTDEEADELIGLVNHYLIVEGYDKVVALNDIQRYIRELRLKREGV